MTILFRENPDPLDWHLSTFMTCPFCTLLSSHSFPHLCLSGTLSLHPNPWDCFWFSAKSNQLGSLIFRTLCNSPAFILFSTFHLENPHFKVRLKCLPLAHSLPGLCLQSLMYPSISTCIALDCGLYFLLFASQPPNREQGLSSQPDPRRHHLHSRYPSPTAHEQALGTGAWTPN